MFLSANLIHDGIAFLPQGSAISINDEGDVLELLEYSPEGTIIHDGILAPGFVNAHCHIELSHMKGSIAEHTGLIAFLKNVSLCRNNYSEIQKETARTNAYNELINNGIVAVGDISNSTETLGVRALDKLHFHTFIEALGFSEHGAATSFNYALKTYNAFCDQPQSHKLLKQSITPHAPYSVSSHLFRTIDAFDTQSLLSIHNQETEEEGRYYKLKEGGIRDLFSALGIDDTYFRPTGQSSIRSFMHWLQAKRKYIFVHNTFTEREDIQHIKDLGVDAFWCLCPNANLYIENRLPDVNMFLQENISICVGTDSLASNKKLCILSELSTLKNHFPSLSWETLLRFGTYNGALALQMQDVAGRIEVGKRPGINLITGLEATGNPKVTKII
ncbi:MAG: amidohydrolase family protein [Taibaiella sp.]|nr:amidohydrolase family protein [Taibaiella sp.]